MIGKPGDSLYFYGGKIYGADKDGNPIDTLLDDPWMEKTEHIPFITFEGEFSTPGNNTVIFNHFDLPIGKLTFNQLGTHKGEIYTAGKWHKERPFSKEDSGSPASFKDFWGIGNFAMARLLSREELKEFTSFDPDEVGEGELYLQLKHSPNLTYPPPRLYKEGRYMGVQLPAFESVIPLKKEHIDAIMDNIYTSRFVIENGRAHRYSAENGRYGAGNPNFSDVPDGTYEFFKGKPEKVGFLAWSSEVPQNHPLNKRSTERTKELFNIGIEMFTAYEPYSFFQIYYPHRYAYFRDGDLYLLGAPILKKDDPVLKKFIEEEKQRAEASTEQRPYLPFIDRGAPLKNGKVDVEFVKKFGVKIPEKRYVALGDNHAMSKDSRLFGFVPEENLQGVPSLLLWPPGERWGMPPQTSYPVLTASRLIVWGIAALLILGWYLFHRYRMSRRLFPD
jgi:signal peptidase I